MANWLQKITSTLAVPKKSNLPALRQDKVPGAFNPPPPGLPSPPLSNATLIYGIASSALFVVGIYYIISGRWFTGLLVCIVGGCLLGFALQYMKR